MRFLKSDPGLKSLRRDLRSSQTDTEKYLWSRLRGGQMGARFLRQYSVGPYILDFYCPSLKLGIELDGGQHNEAQAIELDKKRTEFIESKGVRVLRFWNNDVMQRMGSVMERIYEEMMQRR